MIYTILTMIHHGGPPMFQHFLWPPLPRENRCPGGAGSTSNQPLRSLDSIRPETQSLEDPIEKIIGFSSRNHPAIGDRLFQETFILQVKNLVGGLEHEVYFLYIGNNHPN